MLIYDLDIRQINDDYFALNMLIKYRINQSKYSVDEIINKICTSRASFFRLKRNGFQNNMFTMNKIMELLNIRDVTKDEINEFEKKVDNYFTHIYYANDKIESSYKKIMENYETHINTPLVFYYCLIYLFNLFFYGNVEGKNVCKAISFLNTYYDYFSSNIKDFYDSIYIFFQKNINIPKKEEIISQELNRFNNYPRYKACYLYRYSYYLSMEKKDYQKAYEALAYSNKVFIEDDNFNRLLHVQYGMATFLNRLGQYDECMKILKKILLATANIKMEGINEKFAYPAYAHCLLNMGEYEKAYKVFASIDNNNEIMFPKICMLYCAYKMENDLVFNELYLKLDKMLDSDIRQKYLKTWIKLIKSFKIREAKSRMKSKYRNVLAYINLYWGEPFTDIIQKEAKTRGLY